MVRKKVKASKRSGEPSAWRIILHYPIQFSGNYRMYLSLIHGFFFRRRRRDKPEKVIVEERD